MEDPEDEGSDTVWKRKMKELQKRRQRRVDDRERKGGDRNRKKYKQIGRERGKMEEKKRVENRLKIEDCSTSKDSTARTKLHCTYIVCCRVLIGESVVVLDRGAKIDGKSLLN